MAIDTTEKKLSLIGFGWPFRLTLPVADGSLDQGDKQHLLGLYSGVESGAPPSTPSRLMGKLTVQPRFAGKVRLK